MINLTLGLLDTSSGVSNLLSAEGLSYDVLYLEDILKNHLSLKYKILICIGKVKADIGRILMQHARNGLSILSDADFAKSLGIATEDCTQKILSCNGFRLNSNEIKDKINRIENGYIGILPFSIKRLIFDNGIRENIFFTGNKRDNFVTERISRVDKGKIAKIFIKFLEELHVANDIPYIHKWYFPHNKKSLFSFRVDFDEYEEGDFNCFVYEISRMRQAFSLFINCDIYSQHRLLLLDLKKRGFDIQSHGMAHHIFNGKTKNSKNISAAKNFLENLSIYHKGFSAPMGKHNSLLYDILYDYGYEFSSEFSYLYDFLPCYNFSITETKRILQIPVYPICLGSFLDKGFSAKIAFKFIIDKIEERISAQQPAIFYGHPVKRLGRYPEFIRGIIDYIETQNDIWAANFSDINDWWRKRDSVSHEICFDRSKYMIRINNNTTDNDDIVYRIIYKNKMFLLNAENIKKQASVLSGHSENADRTFDFIFHRDLKANNLKLLKRKIDDFIRWELLYR